MTRRTIAILTLAVAALALIVNVAWGVQSERIGNVWGVTGPPPFVTVDYYDYDTDTWHRDVNMRVTQAMYDYWASQTLPIAVYINNNWDDPDDLDLRDSGDNIREL